MNQIGTTGTKLLKTSRPRRKIPLGRGMRLAPEAVRAAPHDKLSLFVPIPGLGGAGLKSLARSWSLWSAFDADRLIEAEKVVRIGSERGRPAGKRPAELSRSGQI